MSQTLEPSRDSRKQDPRYACRWMVSINIAFVLHEPIEKTQGQLCLLGARSDFEVTDAETRRIFYRSTKDGDRELGGLKSHMQYTPNQFIYLTLAFSSWMSSVLLVPSGMTGGPSKWKRPPLAMIHQFEMDDSRRMKTH